jgi:hypothetical protein
MIKTGVFGWVGAAALLMASSAQAAGGVQAAFVVLGENGAAEARVVTASASCPPVTVDGKTLAMSVRAPAETAPQRETRSAPEDSKPSAYPVTACEATLPVGAKRASVEGRALPLPKAQPTRIVVIGDTGCRVKKSDNAYQACNDAREYPFARVAASAAAWKPDLVLHVGDYLYRENACADGHPGCAGTVWGYGWDAWNADFFTPASPLLAAAPWIAARGNHESCNRAGQGWWRFIEPRPLVKGRDCNAAKDDDIGDYDDPYAVPIGQGGQVIVIDSSNTANDALKPDSRAAQAYRGDWAKYSALAAKAPYSIMLDHHPLLAFAATQKGGKITLRPGNGGLQSVYGAFSPTFSPPSVKLLLSGHVHVWEALSFSSPHPGQFVAGFSGTQEDIVPLPRMLPADASVAPGAIVKSFSSWVDGFGFMTMVRTGPEAWDVEAHDVNGLTVNRCKVLGKDIACDTPQVVAPPRP